MFIIALVFVGRESQVSCPVFVILFKHPACFDFRHRDQIIADIEDALRQPSTGSSLRKGVKKHKRTPGPKSRKFPLISLGS